MLLVTRRVLVSAWGDGVFTPDLAVAPVRYPLAAAGVPEDLGGALVS
ncbi:MAG: hypothetical protein WKF41_13090 [Gaiellaceae bacterium]